MKKIFIQSLTTNPFNLHKSDGKEITLTSENCNGFFSAINENIELYAVDFKKYKNIDIPLSEDENAIKLCINNKGIINVIISPEFNNNDIKIEYNFMKNSGLLIEVDMNNLPNNKNEFNLLKWIHINDLNDDINYIEENLEETSNINENK